MNDLAAGTMRSFLVFDLPVLVAALLALIACGTLGNWIVLRKESMTGDAIAHAVLPGLVAGFLVAGRHSIIAMFVGAAIAGVATILIANWVRRRTKLESGAALGIVFTAFFALGVALLEFEGARQVDLDPGCVLFGALETLFLIVPANGSWIEGVPREIWTLAAAAVIAISFSIAFAKELAAIAFDREHAQIAGVSPRWLEQLMLFVTSMAIVASFEAVGSVLVIALLACPSLIAAPHVKPAQSIHHKPRGRLRTHRMRLPARGLRTRGVSHFNGAQRRRHDRCASERRRSVVVCTARAAQPPVGVRFQTLASALGDHMRMSSSVSGARDSA